MTPARVARGALAGASILLVLAGCESTAPAPGAASLPPTMAEARFRPIGVSSLAGAAILAAYDGGVRIQVTFQGEGPGQYRVMVHANGNCGSPNGFSAGAPWAPPGVPLKEEGYPIHKGDNSGSFVVRLPGYRIDGPDGVLGRSVVVHAGAVGSLAAVPDAPNNRIGCGVIGPPSKGLLDYIFRD